MKLRDLLKEIKAVPGSGVNILALVDKLKAQGDFEEGYKVIAYRESKFKTKNDEAFLIELFIETNKVYPFLAKKLFTIIEYIYYPEFNHFEYYNTSFGSYEPEDERIQDIIKNRNFTIINPPITEIKAKPALKLPSGFDIEQAFYDFFNVRQVSPPKGKFNEDEQFLGIKYKTIDGEELIEFYFQAGGLFNEKFKVVYNLDDTYSPNKNYTTWLGYRDIDQTGLMKEIKAVPPRAHPLNIEAIWDFVSQDELKGELGPFDINKNYIGYERIPFGKSNANMHLIKTYFRDNRGNPFNVIYSYNYGRPNGYDFFNWWSMDEDEIPNNLLREIKVVPGGGESRLPFSIEDVKKRSYEDYLKRQKHNPFIEKETKNLEFIGYTASSEDGITTYNLYFAYTYKSPALWGSMNYKKIPVRYNNSNENDPKQEIGTFKILRKWPNFESPLSKNEVPFDNLIN